VPGGAEVDSVVAGRGRRRARQPHCPVPG
jgi:hypothetical protein